MDKASFFILNIFLNSFLAFLTVIFLIEMVIFLFRVPQGRIAATMRMVPILKLPLDICLYDFSKWSYVLGVNPLNCEEGTRTLSIMFGSRSEVNEWLFLPFSSAIQLIIPGDMTFTVADMLGLTMNLFVLKMFAALFICFSLAVVIRRLAVYYNSFAVLDSLAKISKPLGRKVHNLFLSSFIGKRSIQILTSPVLKGSPFVAGLISPIVYVPECLSKKLSQNEYEAVLAHEIEHIRFKDSWIRLILDFIETIFWWIPTKWLRNRIEEGQEMGCDSKCTKYGTHRTDLASAVCKSAKYSINIPDYIFAHHLTKKTIHERLNVLLKPVSGRYRKLRFAFAFLAIGIAFSMVLPSRFWMF